MQDSPVQVFTHSEFDQHEQVVFCHDRDSGLRAIIAVHSTALGPSLGGVRMWSYADDGEALRDVLRLARGMTYKSALAGLALGGGKSVIIGDPARDKTPAMMQAMGRHIERLGGLYIAAEDSGTTVEDLRAMRRQTRHVVGIEDKPAGAGAVRSGDPSPSTARGVFVGIGAAAAHAFASRDLAGLRVAIQGVGSVGHKLAGLLQSAGARLWVCDRLAERASTVAGELGAVAVPAEAVFDLDVDVFAPCAMGAVLNDDTIGRLRARVVAGAANNQLAQPRHALALAQRGIVYAPDYVINAGGVIDVAQELQGFDADKVEQSIAAIEQVLAEIFRRAASEGCDTQSVADAIARERIGDAAGRRRP